MPNCILTDEIVAQARRRYTPHYGCTRQLAAEYGVGYTAMRFALTGKTHRRVIEPPPIDPRHIHKNKRLPTCASVRLLRHRGNALQQRPAALAAEIGVNTATIIGALKGDFYPYCGGPILYADTPRPKAKRMTDDDAKSARRQYEAGMAVSDMEAIYGVSYRTIYRAISGESHAHITDPPPMTGYKIAGGEWVRKRKSTA